MTQLHLPWLELVVLTPMVGAAFVYFVRSADKSRQWCLIFCALTLAFAAGGWQDFLSLHKSVAHDRWDLIEQIFGYDYFVVDGLSAPLLPLSALLYLLVAATTLRTKIRRFSFTAMLAGEAILMATFSCQTPWLLVLLLAAGTLPPYFELRARNRPTRVYVAHMGAFVGLMVLGLVAWQLTPADTLPSLWVVIPLLGAVLLRSGIVPVHCWMTDLFEHATFGTALLYVLPMTGAYAVIRLVLPIAPDWVLQSIGIVSLTTALYAACMALVQHEARRFFCYLFLSHSSLVLVGLESVTPLGLTGSLCVWLSIGLSLGGFGLTLRSIESRTGRLTLDDFHGLYDQVPALATFLLLTGLASVGFPGTFGFIGTELLIDGVVHTYPWIGMVLVISAAINGIAVLRTYLLLFAGRPPASSIDLRRRPRENFAVLVLALLILAGGIFPQPGVSTSNRAAQDILAKRLVPSSHDESHDERQVVSKPTVGLSTQNYCRHRLFAKWIAPQPLFQNE